jgi:hypothetical protein
MTLRAGHGPFDYVRCQATAKGMETSAPRGIGILDETRSAKDTVIKSPQGWLSYEDAPSVGPSQCVFKKLFIDQNAF